MKAKFEDLSKDGEEWNYWDCYFFS
jgi:hypothetical protein